MYIYFTKAVIESYTHVGCPKDTDKFSGIFALLLLSLSTQSIFNIIGVSYEDCVEVCITETEEIRCPDRSVITVTSADYGRMQLGKCVQMDIYTGCSVDILALADSWCSGLETCQVSNQPGQMIEQAGFSCSKEMASYIDIQYSCVEGSHNFVHVIFIPGYLN